MSAFFWGARGGGGDYAARVLWVFGGSISPKGESLFLSCDKKSNQKKRTPASAAALRRGNPRGGRSLGPRCSGILPRIARFAIHGESSPDTDHRTGAPAGAPNVNSHGNRLAHQDFGRGVGNPLFSLCIAHLRLRIRAGCLDHPLYRAPLQQRPQGGRAQGAARQDVALRHGWHMDVPSMPAHEHVHPAGCRASARRGCQGCAFFGYFLCTSKESDSPLGEINLQRTTTPERRHRRHPQTERGQP